MTVETSKQAAARLEERTRDAAGIRDFAFDMDVNINLKPEAVACATCLSAAEILEHISEVAASVYALDQMAILEGLEEREKFGSTGFGRAVAIPHCRSTHVRRPSLVVLVLDKPVDFRAADGVPINLAFGLVSPENAGATHLHALAAISRLARDEKRLSALRDAPDTEALYAVLDNQFLRDAA
jgi:PTS system nitrogen regulatory IIA component